MAQKKYKTIVIACLLQQTWIDTRQFKQFKEIQTFTTNRIFLPLFPSGWLVTLTVTVLLVPLIHVGTKEGWCVRGDTGYCWAESCCQADGNKWPPQGNSLVVRLPWGGAKMSGCHSGGGGSLCWQWRPPYLSSHQPDKIGENSRRLCKLTYTAEGILLLVG